MFSILDIKDSCFFMNYGILLTLRLSGVPELYYPFDWLRLRSYNPRREDRRPLHRRHHEAG
jgi:hypothetical protein